MKALVVDDDRTARALLRRILNGIMKCEVIEAADGLEALEQIHREQPDIVLLDIEMPKLGGVEVLETIRATNAYANLPVVANSSLSDQESVLSMIRLGVADYILKSERTAALQSRLSRVMRQIVPQDRHEPQLASHVATADIALLVEKDPNFRSFVRPLLESAFEVHECDNAFDAIKFFGERNPPVVLVGDHLDLMPAPVFARILREASNGTGLRLILMSSGMQLSERDAAVFDAVARKSFVPDEFVPELHQSLQTSEAAAYRQSLLTGDIRNELLTAIQQTVGVLTDQDVELLETVNGIERETRALVMLTSSKGTDNVTMALAGAQDDVTKLAAAIVGEELSMEDGAADAFAEVASTIGGRLRSSLATRGFALEQGAPEFVAEEHVGSDAPDRLVIPFKTASGERFVLSVAVGECGA